MNIFVVAPMEDRAAGFWIYNSIIELGHRAAYFDWRRAGYDKGAEEMNKNIVEATEKLKPDLTIILKGVGIPGRTINEYDSIWASTIRKMREVHNHTIVGWLFDVTLGGVLVTDSRFTWYIKMLKELDKFYTLDESALDELEVYGVNSSWLSEGCYPPMHEAPPYNAVQRRIYGGDVSFIGNVGSVHPNREEILSQISEEGFGLKIFGNVGYQQGSEPIFVKDHHSGYEVRDDMFAIVANASKVNIGIDGWPHRSRSYADRVYKILCAGGFLLTNHTKGIEKDFTVGKHLDTYKDNNELVEKLIYYLTHSDERERIAEEGRKFVLNNHKFANRLTTMFRDLGFNC